MKRLFHGVPMLVARTAEDAVEVAARAVADLASKDELGSIVVSGGASAPVVLRSLADLWTSPSIPTVILSDERWSDDPAFSNRLQIERILVGSRFAGASIVAPIFSDDPAEAAQRWAADLRECPSPHVAVLGMGDDGHVASLFPGVETDGVTEQVSICWNSPKPPPIRLSVSLNFLRSIPSRFVVTAGAAKREAIRLVGDGVMLPVAQLTPTTWFVDREAEPSSHAD